MRKIIDGGKRRNDNKHRTSNINLFDETLTL